jgi:hypothetical protein
VGTDSVLGRCLPRLQDGRGVRVLVGWERGARPTGGSAPVRATRWGSVGVL